jgi:hypothetical protein
MSRHQSGPALGFDPPGRDKLGYGVEFCRL